MKDFDFDELDRAVNSVLTQNKTTTNKPVVSSPAPAPVIDTSGSDNITVNVTPAPVVDAPEPSTSSGQSITVTDALNEANDEQTVVPEVATETSQTETPDSNELTPSSSDDPATETEVPAEDRELTLNVPDRPATGVESPSEITSEEQSDTTHKNIEFTPDQDSTQETSSEAESEEVPEVDTPAQTNDESLDLNLPETIPQKRGQFMDVVRPSAAIPIKPRAVQPRGGVTLQPTSGFTLSTPAIDVSKALEDTDQPAVVSSSTASNAQSDVAPLISTTHQTTATMNDKESTSDKSAMFPQPEPEPEVESEHKAMNHTPLDFGKMSEVKKDVTADESTPTPFIPDVAVEKRPLNSLQLDESDEAGDATSSTTPEAATVGAGLPKEFNKEILDIDSKETVAPAPQTESVKPMTFSPEPPTSAKTDASSQPLFDMSSIHQPLIDIKSSASHKTMWILIFVALFIVGAALGMLYFLYGQH